MLRCVSGSKDPWSPHPAAVVAGGACSYCTGRSEYEHNVVVVGVVLLTIVVSSVVAQAILTSVSFFLQLVYMDVPKNGSMVQVLSLFAFAFVFLLFLILRIRLRALVPPMGVVIGVATTTMVVVVVMMMDVITQNSKNATAVEKKEGMMCVMPGGILCSKKKKRKKKLGCILFAHNLCL